MKRDLFMNLFEIITSVDWELWQGILDVIMTFLGIFTYKKYRNFIFRLVLGFGKRKECIVSLPAHHAKVLNRDRELIIKEEAQPCFKLVNHLNAAGIKVNFSQSEIESTNNEIHIGGPASNPHTNRYFCRYFQNIKWQATESHVALYKSDPTLRMFNFDYIQISEDGAVAKFVFAAALFLRSEHSDSRPRLLVAAKISVLGRSKADRGIFPGLPVDNLFIFYDYEAFFSE